jgi:PAS domain S-box-containing protein
VIEINVPASDETTLDVRVIAERLRFTTERLTIAEEAAGALIYDWDIDTNKVWRSGGLTRILGWLPEDISNKMEDWTKLCHADDVARLSLSTYLDASLPDDRYAVEYRVRHKSGHYVWVLDSGRVFKNATGQTIRVAGATVDISARKKMETSSSRQANLIDLSFEPIFVWHPVRGIVDWNRGAEQLYGYKRDEAIGQSSMKLLRTNSSISAEDLFALLKTSNSRTAEFEHQAKDGSRIWVEGRQQAIESDGEWLVLETNHNINHRRNAESYTARMAAVAVASHDALFGITLDGVVETWNPAAERLFGYLASEMIGQHVSILAEASRHNEQIELMRRAINLETVGPYTARRMRKDGSFVDVSVALAPVKAPDGRVTSLSVAIHDISDRKEWEARQRLMTRELAHRSKNSFAVLQGILRSTLRTARNSDDFAEAFSGRLHSLAAAQDVLTDSEWRGAELGALARRQLATYVLEGDKRIDITGPLVNLPAEYAAPLGLIFNELATNATKYGALSVLSGNVQLYWRTERMAQAKLKLNLTWRERGGPDIITPGPRGFGSTLIEKCLPDAKVESAYETAGLTCKIELVLSTAKKRNSFRGLSF